MKQNGKTGPRPGKNGPLSPAKARAAKWKESIVNHYVKGNSIASVVEIMKEETGGHKFSFGSVSKYVNEAVEDWKRNATDLIANHKAIELEKINRLEVAAWYGWQLSLTVKNTVKTKKIPGKDGETPAPTVKQPSNNRQMNGKRGKKTAAAVESPFNTVEVTDEARASAGDSRYFATIQWCIEYRCKLLGTEAPVKVETNSTINANVNQTTTLLRTVVFRTRQTTAAPQTLPAAQNN